MEEFDRVLKSVLTSPDYCSITEMDRDDRFDFTIVGTFGIGEADDSTTKRRILTFLDSTWIPFLDESYTKSYVPFHYNEFEVEIWHDFAFEIRDTSICGVCTEQEAIETIVLIIQELKVARNKFQSTCNEL
jgi:hypothetical protein